RVRAIDNAGNAGENAQIYFRVDTIKPAPPTAVWPVQAKTNDNTPLLQWSPPPENSLPLRYYVWVLDEDLTIVRQGPQNYPGPGMLENFWEVTPALVDGEYYWTVAAIDNAGNVGDNCGNKWFRVDIKKPAVPIMRWPADGENINDNTPTLDWDPATLGGLPLQYDGSIEYSTPLRYKVWIARDVNFTDIVMETDWITNDYLEVTPELQDNVYYWKVSARDDAGNIGDNTAARSFRVDTLPPENVFLISPENNQLVASTPLLDWNPAVDNSLPVVYRVVVSVYENFQENIRD
ncbi:MAG: hypothetical protein ACK4GQ_06430, partial [Candidatus Hadarchaeales archaeon]